VAQEGRGGVWLHAHVPVLCDRAGVERGVHKATVPRTVQQLQQEYYDREAIEIETIGEISTHIILKGYNIECLRICCLL